MFIKNTFGLESIDILLGQFYIFKICPLGTPKTLAGTCRDNDETQPELVTTIDTPPTAPKKKVQSFEDANERRSQYQNVPLINFDRKTTAVPDATASLPVGNVPAEPTPPEPKPATKSEKPPTDSTKDKEVRGSPKKIQQKCFGEHGIS